MTYKVRFIACTTTELSKLLTSYLTTVKQHVIKYCDTVYERDSINLFWSIKNSTEVLNKFKSKGFMASELATYDFCMVYTTLPDHLIKDKLIALIEHMFTREKTLYWLVMKNMLFSLLMYIKIISYGPVKTFVKRLFIFWIICSLDLELKFIDKL